MSPRALSLKEANRVRRRLIDVRRSYPSQKALAKALGVSQQTVSAVLSMQAFAGYPFCMRLAKLLRFPSAEALIAAPYTPPNAAQAALSA